MRKLYLCGPMTGLPEFNRPAFHAAAAELRAAGYHVENPADLPAGWTWHVYMRIGLKRMLDCSGVAVLPGGVGQSAGANKEVDVAQTVGIEVLSVRQWLIRAKVHHGGTEGTEGDKCAIRPAESGVPSPESETNYY